MRWRTSFTVLTCVVAVATAGCEARSESSDEAHPGAHSVEARASAAPSSTGAAAAPTPAATPLYSRLTSSSATGDTGQALTATLGGTTYPGATGVWIGCEGTAATAVYRLGGEFARLTGVLGLQPHTPAGLRVRISVIVDGDTKRVATLTRDDPPQNLVIPLDGARSVTVAALAIAGECALAAAPYGAIGAAGLS
ncbi:NPCBM/NEW2 domain-containing protein [Tsukamurella paurometabola]|uniref:NPCBM/NEW2 domain-containing protein n=1 Tax=Tsukamurella paurometabola TaxID=2061 RepID=UPI000F7D7A8F|nr:NPCBM/NEW2 domain-containing protein [Tsukamurella paurometabola]UEA84751.1 hypothetical protein LK411_08015 [Tsukamurella paurometabola]